MHLSIAPPHSPTPRLDGEIVGISQSTMSRTPTLGDDQVSVHLSIARDLTYTMLIAHVNFTYAGGRTPVNYWLIPLYSTGWGSGMYD